LITHVESALEEVTVDSLSSKAKNELETHYLMISQHWRCSTRVNIQRVATAMPLHIAAEPHLPRATASIQSPEAKACPTRPSSKNCIRSA
jgi:hypothetical protein